MFLVMLSIGLKSNDMQISLTQGGIFLLLFLGGGQLDGEGGGVGQRLLTNVYVYIYNVHTQDWMEFSFSLFLNL